MKTIFSDFTLKLKIIPATAVMRGGGKIVRYRKLEHRHHLHNKALELSVMWRNLQRPEMGLR